jgi:hypothetical protein
MRQLGRGSSAYLLLREPEIESSDNCIELTKIQPRDVLQFGVVAEVEKQSRDLLVNDKEGKH